MSSWTVPQPDSPDRPPGSPVAVAAAQGPACEAAPLDGTHPAGGEQSPVEALLDRFRPISLDELDKTSKMLKRVDNKYLVDAEQVPGILERMSACFRVLVIDDIKVFSYRSCYFDDAFSAFREHHRGIRNRVKVRRRQYVESGKVFFEVKLKGKRGSTNKIRARCGDHLDSQLTAENLSILERFYQETYRKAFPYDLDPSLIVSFKRISLASARGGERVTIDFDLRFESTDGESFALGREFIIVETKTSNGRGQADEILKAKGIRRAKPCSKYCIGAILSGKVTKYNKFRPIMKVIRDRAARTGTSLTD